MRLDVSIGKLNPQASYPVQEKLPAHPESRNCLPFVESTKFVFSTMLGCDAILGESETLQEFRLPYDLHSQIDLTGALTGSVVLSFEKKVVFHAAQAMLGELPTEVDSEVLDLVGELANLIGGNGKERLKEKAVSLGLPKVNCELAMLTKTEHQPVRFFPFSTAWGQFSVEVVVSA